MQNPLANIHWRFLLVRDDWGFQVNPLYRHDITSPFPPLGNEGYVRNRDISEELHCLAEEYCYYYFIIKGVAHRTRSAAPHRVVPCL